MTPCQSDRFIPPLDLATSYPATDRSMLHANRGDSRASAEQAGWGDTAQGSSSRYEWRGECQIVGGRVCNCCSCCCEQLPAVTAHGKHQSPSAVAALRAMRP